MKKLIQRWLFDIEENDALKEALEKYLINSILEMQRMDIKIAEMDTKVTYSELELSNLKREFECLHSLVMSVEKEKEDE